MNLKPGVKIRWVTSARRSDRKSTRLNSSHSQISYAVFCLKKKKKTNISKQQQVYENLRQIIIEPKTSRQQFANDRFKEVNCEVGDELKLILNQRWHMHRDD